MNTINSQQAGTEKAIMEYQTSTGDPVKLTMPMVRKYLVQGYPDMVTDQEIIYFMHICKSRKLNPFTKDCYLIKYSTKDNAAIVTSVEYFRKNAMKNRTCKGWSKGVIVQDKEGKVKYSHGIVLDHEIVLGGWFKAKPEGWDREFIHEVPLKPYIKKTKEGKTTSFWSEDKQSFMISKVAEAQGLKTLWGEECTGMYSHEEATSISLVSPKELTLDTNETKDDIQFAKVFDTLLSNRKEDSKYMDQYIQSISELNNLTVTEVKAEAIDHFDAFFNAFLHWRIKKYPNEFAVRDCQVPEKRDTKKEPPPPSFIPDYTARNSAMSTNEKEKVENNHQVQNKFDIYILPDFKGKIAMRFGAEKVQAAIDFISSLAEKNHIPFKLYVETSLQPENFEQFCKWFENDTKKPVPENKEDIAVGKVLDILNKNPAYITGEEWESIWNYCKHFKKTGYSAFILDNKELVENSPIEFYDQCKEKWDRICEGLKWTYTHISNEQASSAMNESLPVKPKAGNGQELLNQIEDEKEMFPELYQMAIEKYGEPETVEDCQAIHKYINDLIDLQNEN